ncbi:MAG TPA: aminopeptidase P family protein [bacterium]|jgi:Xaa-Pro aminopeptidase
MNIKSRLSALRKLLAAYRIQAYVVPSTDAHQSEYVPTFWHRREWISGFTGSAGDVAITPLKAALWTDGRYFLQAEAQLSGSGISLMKLGMPGTPTIAAWLGKQLKKGNRVGVDPRLFSVAQFQKMKADLDAAGIELVSIESNLIDDLWADQPAAPDGIIETHPVAYSGERFQDKLKKVRKAMHAAGATGHVIAALDCIAWLFNIRGSDVLHNPVVIAYAIVTDKEALLFTDPAKLTPEVLRAFGQSVTVKPYDDFRAALIKLSKSGGPVWLDPNTTNQWIADLIKPRASLMLKDSPIVMMKSLKNAVEIRGARKAHVRDGAAMVKFLYWLDQTAGREKLTEISVAEKLEGFRAKSKLFRGVSFDSIIGYAGHGAIIHYSATPETDVPIRRKGILLVDSGGQYLDGTTDITRTISLSPPSVLQKDQFTRVLKGHIQVVMARFPHGTAGRQIDTLARKALWDAGYDYNHGTGHGVGSYLSVHEGPQSISYARDTGIALQPGMVISNEPGYYAAGEYGIRTENLIYVVQDKENSRDGKVFLTFENLTLCPIDTRLINPKLLSPEELRYLNAYHAQVKKVLTPLLDKKEAAWLSKATRPIR